MQERKMLIEHSKSEQEHQNAQHLQRVKEQQEDSLKNYNNILKKHSQDMSNYERQKAIN